MVDSWFVGFLGTDALAAIAGTAFALWMLGSLMELAGTGTQALVAQAIGAGAADKRLRALGAQGLWVAGAVSVVVFVLRATQGAYFDLLALDGPARDLGLTYLDASMLGAGTLLVQGALVGVYRGIGDNRAALVVSGVALVANALLDPLFMFTLNGGIAGAAWATVVANGLGAAAAGVDLARRGLAPWWRIEPATVRRILAIGTPLAVQNITFSLVYVVLGRVLSPFGPGPLAALGLGHRIESLPYLFCVAVELSVATLVGQAVGAGDLPTARRIAHQAARFAALVMLPLGAVLFVFAGPAFALFTDDVAIIAAGTTYLRIQAVVWWAMAAESVYTGAFAGAGRTGGPLVINATLSTLRVPVAAALATVLGADGVWIAIGASTFAKGVALAAWWAMAPLASSDVESPLESR